MYFYYNLISFLNFPLPGNSLADRKQVIDYIKNQTEINEYPCISINYISVLGESVGFRYLSWWKGLNVIRSGKGAPVYNIIIPWNISPKESNPIFENLE